MGRVEYQGVDLCSTSSKKNFRHLWASDKATFFFAGYDFTNEILSDQNAIHQAYQTAVHIGGEIHSDGNKVPKFFVWVTKDPQSGFLQRAQIVKGWMEGDESKEFVCDVSCFDGS